MPNPAHDLAALGAEHGTPFFLYDMDAARAQLSRLRAHLPRCVDVLYAMKANPCPGVLAGLRDAVAGLDVSSAGEIALACAAGYALDQMSFAGPGKTDAELERAIGGGIHLLSIESPGELERAIAVAERLGTTARVTVRINPQQIPNAFAMKMGGRPSQFGVAEEDADAVIALAARSPRIALAGIHIYAGTQCLELEAIVENIEQTLQIGARVAATHDLRPTVINLGGGFGVPHFPGEAPLDVDALSRRVGAAITAFVAETPRCAQTRFLLELGRFIIGPFGSYVTRVVEVKQTRGKRFAILDGGMNHCFAATGNFGQLIKKNYVVENLSRPEAAQERTEIVGPLCTPLDAMARAAELPRPEVGDLLRFASCGAYGYTASPLLFLGHSTPAELVRVDGEVHVARPRRAVAELFG
jgi:diaminopimelate decarboxylase